MNYKGAIISFIIVFLIVFIVDYFFINRKRLNLMKNDGKTKKGKTKKVKSISELDYLTAKFKLDKRKIKKERVIIAIAIINSFIIAFVSSIIMLLPLKRIWQMLIAFVLLFSLIYACYEIYGRHLKKEEKRK